MMTDGNTHAINQYLDEREDWDALQEVTAELEQAEARIEELEAELEGLKKLMLALAGDKIDLVSELAGVKFKLSKAVEAEAKLAKAVLSVKRLSTSECFGSSEVWGLSLSDSPLGREILARMDYANTTLAELSSVSCANLKGEINE